MKILTILSSVLLLSGCAAIHPDQGNFGGCKSHCLFGFIGPGNPVFDAYGKHRNTQDPCQLIGKPEGWTFPNYCFANAGKRVYYVRDVNNRIIYKVTP
jgi:hypothetical protein